MQRTLITQVLLLAALRLVAQNWQVYDMVSAGFPTNTITSIAVDGDGDVWAGTDWGLGHFDGSTWEFFQEGNSDIPDDLINAVAVDSLDRIWIGTYAGGLICYDGATWEQFDTTNTPLPANEIKSVMIDHRGWIWIGTYLGLICRTDTEWRIYDQSPGSYGGLVLNGNVIEDVDVRSDGLVAIGTLNYGFHYLTDSVVQVHATYIDMFPDNSQLGVLMDEVNDERWLATPSQGLLRQGGGWYDGPWFQYTMLNSNLPTNSLSCLAQDDDGKIWIGSGFNGVIRRNSNGSFSNFNTLNSGLPDDHINELVFDQQGALWVATYYGGVARFLPLTGTAEGLVQDLQLFPVPASDRLYISTGGRGPALDWAIFDALGRPVREGVGDGATLFEVDVSGLVPGSYVAHITFPSGQAAEQIIIDGPHN